tara:strand:+ start:6894 stop:7163 length:270 start_codon:yes stop_codon:yes gene_type:complete
MTVKEFEEAVWQLEGIRLVIREASGAEVADYDYDRAAYRTHSITEWLRNRIYPRLDGLEAVVINGYGEIPNGRTRLDNLRATYEETVCE